MEKKNLYRKMKQSLSKLNPLEKIIWIIFFLSIISIFIFFISALLSNSLGRLFNWNNNFLPWILSSLGVMATSLTGLLIHRQFNLESKRFEQTETSGLSVEIEPYSETLKKGGYLINSGIEIRFAIHNPSIRKNILCEVFIVLKNDNTKHTLMQRGDYTNFDYNSIIRFPSMYGFRGHFKIPGQFKNLTEENILSQDFYLIAHYGLRNKNNVYLPKTEEIKMIGFSPKILNGDINYFYSVPKLHIAPKYLNHLAVPTNGL